MVLYHYTCQHSKQKIGTSNCLLVPQIRHPMLGCKVTWLTTEARPDRYRTGLGQSLTNCDRMQYRYVVEDTSRCHPWLGSPERAAAPKWAVEDAESDGDPEHWWIASQPIRARFDRLYVGVPA